MTQGTDNPRLFWGLTGYQWQVLFAAWLGWGFDVFDGLLFNFVSRICVPDLLHLSPSHPNTKYVTTYWTSALSSLLLLGWALGGVVFGRLTDRIGRTKTLLLTMITYALATAACALAPNMYVLALFRFVASLGIGGEWAAGASLVAETVPENKRVTAGALLYTSAPAGLFLATFVNDLFTRRLSAIASNPSLSWRAVFLTGLVPVAVALIIRTRIKEPERWSSGQETPALREIFSDGYAKRTLSGLSMAIVALITWWSCSTFIPLVSSFLADEIRPIPSLTALRALRAQFTTTGTNMFNLGGLLGTLLTVPIATRLGRRPMFALYFLLSAIAVWVTFGVSMAPTTRLMMMFFVGLTVFGVFGSFTFYLPELFPTRLRGTGAGFCYNTGRVITAFFPFAIGVISLRQINPLSIIRWVAIIPLLGVLFVLTKVTIETRGEKLE